MVHMQQVQSAAETQNIHPMVRAPDNGLTTLRETPITMNYTQLNQAPLPHALTCMQYSCTGSNGQGRYTPSHSLSHSLTHQHDDMFASFRLSLFRGQHEDITASNLFKHLTIF
eukprot:PhM_4_TR4096/c0_g1_i1/m.90544